eukprot:184656_1
MCSCSCMKECTCWTRYKEYIKVICFGIATWGLFYGIYAFLTNVDVIRVMPDGYYFNKGIRCEDGEYDYCHNVARTMAHAAEINAFDIITELTTTTSTTETPTSGPTLSPTLSPTIDNSSICVSGSTRQTKINGRYIYSSWNFELNGPIYNNTQNDLYLYPYIWPDSTPSKRYYIGRNTSSNTIYSSCYIPDSFKILFISKTITPLDCYYKNGQLRTWNRSTWASDLSAVLGLCETKEPTTASPTETPTKSPIQPTTPPTLSATLAYGNLCFMGANNATYDGTYQFFAISDRSSVSGLIWKHSLHDIYLYPFNDSGSIQWKAGESYNIANTSLSCNASATYNGYYAILDEGCYNWQEHVFPSGWITNNKILILPGDCGSVVPLHEWKCSAYTHYRDGVDHPDKIWNKFSSFRVYLDFIITFAVLYGLFCIIHDCILIYFKQNPDSVSFSPESHEELLLPFIAIYCCCIDCNNDAVKMIYVIFFMPIDFLIAPIFSCCCCCDYSTDGDDDSTDGDDDSTDICRRCLESSASFVGLSRIFMCLLTSALFYKVSWGISFSIQSLDENKCKECSCNYIFTKNDYWMFFCTTVTFIVLSGIFLYSWIKEASTGNHFLYLLQYRLPIKHAHAINPDDSTAHMFKEIELIPLSSQANSVQMSVITRDANVSGGTINNGGAEEKDINDTEYTDDNDALPYTIQQQLQQQNVANNNANVSEQNEAAVGSRMKRIKKDENNKKFGFAYRIVLVSSLVTCSFYILTSALFESAFWNYCHYPSWVENIVILVGVNVVVNVMISALCVLVVFPSPCIFPGMKELKGVKTYQQIGIWTSIFWTVVLIFVMNNSAVLKIKLFMTNL